MTISCCHGMTCSRVMTSYYFHLFSHLFSQFKFIMDVGQSTDEDTFSLWNLPHSLALGHVLDLNIFSFFSTWNTYHCAPYTTAMLSPISISEICIVVMVGRCSCFCVYVRQFHRNQLFDVIDTANFSQVCCRPIIGVVKLDTDIFARA